MERLALCLILVFAVCLVVYLHFFFLITEDIKGADVYHYWLEGNRILSGQNPYARILSGDMRDNNKYATHFPLFYLLSALAQKAGLADYGTWVYFWRIVFPFFNLGIAFLLFIVFYRRKWLIFSIFAPLFWLFNRWTIDLIRITQIDFIPIFFLLLSVVIFRTRKWPSFLFFSISLAIKGLAIFLAPLYLIWFWHSMDKRSLKKLSLAAFAISSVPLLTSLPFIFWNAEGFLKAILFNVTRDAMLHFRIFSIDYIIHLSGFCARLPMLGLMALVYIGAIQKKVGLYMGALLLISIFICFSTVLFRQYMCWVIPFVPLSVLDTLPNGKAKAGAA